MGKPEHLQPAAPLQQQVCLSTNLFGVQTRRSPAMGSRSLLKNRSFLLENRVFRAQAGPAQQAGPAGRPSQARRLSRQAQQDQVFGKPSVHAQQAQQTAQPAGRPSTWQHRPLRPSTLKRPSRPSTGRQAQFGPAGPAGPAGGPAGPAGPGVAGKPSVHGQRTPARLVVGL